MKKIYKKRINKLINKITKNNKDFIVLHKNKDIYYFTGFYSTTNDSLILISKKELIFITDGRYVNQFYKEVEGFDLHEAKQDNIYMALNKILVCKKYKKGYLPLNDISYSQYKQIIGNLNINIKDATQIISNIRLIKDKIEIDNIKKAIEISEKALNETIQFIKVGITEIDVKYFLEKKMGEYGSLNPSFDTIVASGKNNGALPHAVPTSRILKKGDLITIDFGATYNHYCADITRTFALGYINEKQEKMYNTVLKAKKIAEDSVKIGSSVSKTHKKVDKFLNNKGYKFVHSTGHGIGINIHEAPTIGAKSKEQFKKNMVHTIEPGVYIAKIGGVRIEDDYVVKKNKLFNLSSSITTDLIIL